MPMQLGREAHRWVKRKQLAEKCFPLGSPKETGNESSDFLQRNMVSSSRNWAVTRQCCSWHCARVHEAAVLLLSGQRLCMVGGREKGGKWQPESPYMIYFPEKERSVGGKS